MSREPSIEEFFSRFKREYSEYRNVPGVFEAIIRPLLISALILPIFFLVSICFREKECIFRCLSIISLIVVCVDLVLVILKMDRKRLFVIASFTFFCIVVVLFIFMEVQRFEWGTHELLHFVKISILEVIQTCLLLSLLLLVASTSLLIMIDDLSNIRTSYKKGKSLIAGSFLVITLILLLVFYLNLVPKQSENGHSSTPTSETTAVLTATHDEESLMDTSENASQVTTSDDLNNVLVPFICAFALTTLTAYFIFFVCGKLERTFNHQGDPAESKAKHKTEEKAKSKHTKSEQDFNADRKGDEQNANEAEFKSLIGITKVILEDLKMYDNVSIEAIENFCNQDINSAVQAERRERFGLHFTVIALIAAEVVGVLADNFAENNIKLLYFALEALVALGCGSWLYAKIKSFDKDEDMKEKREIIYIMRKLKKDMNEN